MARLRNSPLASRAMLTVAAESLARQCKVMRQLHRANGAPPMRDMRADFSGLVQIVCGQQVSAASAAAIWRRVSAGLKPLSASLVLASSEHDLAALGLSRPKIKTLKALAEAIDSGALKIRELNRGSDEQVFAQLTALHGIGPWTADIYLLFALKRSDAFPAGDLALQLAASRLFASPARLAPSELLELAERWRPYRAIAARMLWDEYGRRRSDKTAAVEPAAAPKTQKNLKSRNSL